MRLRLRSWVKRQSTKTLIVLGVVVVVALLVAGGGVYAALGGVGRSQASTDIELQRGLVGWWKMNGDAKDATPYGNNGVATGLTPTTDRKGAANAAYAFGGNNGNIEVPDNASIDATSAITISAWINPTDWAGNRRILQKAGDGQQYNMLYEFGQFKVNLTGLSAGTLAYGTPPPVGQYTLVTVTYDGAFIRLYYNATQVASQAAVNNLATSAAPLVIGNKPGSSVPGDSFYGKIDELRMYKRALSAAEVGALSGGYDAQVNAASGQNGLVGWWKMDGNAKDATPYGNNGTVTGATLAADRKGAANSAYSFDGTTGQYIQVAAIPAITTGSPFTISAWVKPLANGAPGGFRTILGYDNTHRLLVGGTGTMLSQQSGNFVSAAGAVPDGIWTHVVYWNNGAEERWYINGAQSGAASPMTVAEWNAAFMIGQYDLANYPYKGQIDDVRIYKRALTATEISSMYNSYNSQINLQASPTNSQTANINSGLIGYWAMNGNAKDSTPYGRNGSLLGSAALTADRKGRSNSAYALTEAACDGLSIADSAGFQFNGPFSIAFWYSDNGSTAAWPQILSKGSGATSGSGWQIFEGGTTLYFKRDNKYFTYAGAGISSTPAHFVVTYDGTTNGHWYKNGVQVTTTPQTFVADTSTANTKIGGYAGSCIQGTVDDVRFYNRELSTTEVAILAGNYY